MATKKGEARALTAAYCAARRGIIETVHPLEVIVDLLPRRLWSLANLYMLPGGDWHFCVGENKRLGHSVRTVQWRGRDAVKGNLVKRIAV